MTLLEHACAPSWFISLMFFSLSPLPSPGGTTTLLHAVGCGGPADCEVLGAESIGQALCHGSLFRSSVFFFRETWGQEMKKRVRRPTGILDTASVPYILLRPGTPS